MDRLACVDLPGLSLQFLLRREPGWRDLPVAVVDRDDPRGRVLVTNERARQAGVRPGTRYGTALALEPDLRAGVVDEDELRRGCAAIERLLGRFSPTVESSREEPGTWWLDARGVVPLWPSVAAWTREVHCSLTGAGYRATVISGFTRFGTWAIARSERGFRTFDDPREEQDTARRVLLSRLGFAPDVLARLHRLGVSTVGDFLALPPGGVRERWGPEVHRLWRLAAGEFRPPLSSRPPEPPPRAHLDIEPPGAELPRLLAAVERLLLPLLERLGREGREAASLVLQLRLTGRALRRDELRPARPGLDPGRLLELVRLRLEAEPPSAPVEEVVLELAPSAPDPGQASLFSVPGRRDPAAAARALARLRAELGSQAVVRARLVDGHLPEQRFLWEPFPARLPEPAPGQAAPEAPVLVRRILDRPAPLPVRPGPGNSPLILAPGGPARPVAGPFVLSGGWWERPWHREYHWALSARGELLWVFRDRLRRRWYRQGRLE